MATKITRDKDGSITYEKEGDVVKTTKSTHKCIQEEQLERMRLFLVGNGNPKTGIVFKMDKAIDDISEIKESILDIKLKLSETIAAASSAASSLEKYKIEVKSFEAGKDDTEEKQKLADDLNKRDKRDSWQRVFWIIMAILVIFGLGIDIYFNIKGNKKQDEAIQKVDNLGVPMQSVTRGEMKDTVRLFYFPNDDRRFRMIIERDSN